MLTSGVMPTFGISDPTVTMTFPTRSASSWALQRRLCVGGHEFDEETQSVARIAASRVLLTGPLREANKASRGDVR